MRATRKIFRRALVYGVGLTLPVAAQAYLEEVVVTAQKRSESLQDVPVAVTAFTSDTMKALGITEASNLVNVTPGLSAGSQAGSNRNYFLRGVGTADIHLTAASAVGQYYDGITLTSGFHARAALFDMERVEVLKGPQNTLYGLNTTGGAINYISNKPEIDAGTNGSVTLKLGNDSLFGTEGAIGFDIGDTLAARLALQTNKQDGPFKSITDGRDYGDDDMQAYRAALLWQPMDRASLTLNLHGMQNENNGSAVRALGTRHPDGSLNVCPDFGLGELDFEDNTNCLSRDGGQTGEPATDPSTGDWDTVAISLGFEDIETIGYYLNFEYEFDWATLNFITAYDNLDLQVSFDSDGTATQLLHQHQEEDRDTFQYELRLISPGDGAFRWIAGVYYLDEEADSFTGIRSPGIGGGNRIPNVQLDHSKENLGVYFQGEQDLTDSVTLTVGVRWSDEEIVADYLPSAPNAANIPTNSPLYSSDVDTLVRAQRDPTDANLDANGYDVRRQVQQVLPNEDVGYTVKLDWKATGESLIYASFSKGFKGSAADIRAAYALVPPPNILTGLENSRLDPESLDVWEVGYKSSFWDNRIQLDAAAFFYTYNDLQQFTTANGVPTLVNAPESEITGLDANLKYANDSGFFLDFGLSILDSEVTDSTGSPFVEGAELANSPGYSLSVMASQDFELGNGSVLTVTANATHTDDQVKNTLTTANTMTEDLRTQPSYTLLTANVTYRFGSNQQYGLSLFGNNLTDEHYCGSRGVNEGNRVYLDATGNSLSYTATCRVDRGTMRTYGASFTVDF